MAILYARDIDGTGSMHVCAKDDPGAIAFVDIDDEAREALAMAIDCMTAIAKYGCLEYQRPEIEKKVASLSRLASK